MAKTKRLNIRITPYFKQKIKAQSKKERFLRVTDWVIEVLKQRIGGA